MSPENGKRIIIKQFIFFISFFIFININLISAVDSSKPNIILITIDSLRPDHLSCYGYHRNTSPNIDKLAKEGVLFTQVIAQGPATIPSIPSLMTSHYFRSGDWIREMGKIKNLKLSFPTLQEILKTNGYFTIFICAHPVISEIKAFQRGWDRLIKFRNKKPDAKVITQEAIKFLRINYHKPFFFWIHYMDSHAPYRPPLPYKGVFLNDELYFPAKHIPIVDSYKGEGGIPKRLVYRKITDLNFYIAQYDSAIRFVDEQIGFILKEIEELGIEENTFVIITADHGEAFGGHDFFLVHAHALFDEFIKVPLIMKLPNYFLQRKIIPQQIELVDLFPTILEILKINNNYQIQGNSLLPLILGKAGYNKNYAFSTAGIMSCIRTPEWKLVLHEHSTGEKHYFLFNLKNDPEEEINLINLDEKTFRILRDNLSIYLKNTAYEFITGEFLDNTLKNKLQSLGYLQ